MESSVATGKISGDKPNIEGVGDDSVVDAIHSEINESFRFIEDEILQQTMNDSSSETDMNSGFTQPKKDDANLRRQTGERRPPKKSSPLANSVGIRFAALHPILPHSSSNSSYTAAKRSWTEIGLADFVPQQCGNEKRLEEN
ncbi:hypothetical protein V9T40_007406 [Parthenolecanium corni]|uniref:Uncharacterized protein n=1 Tax=Parthenolecanium corni TaxID=536013 RepID=A0AAN9TWB3_9HEMI